jgi:hypothetical protein
LLFTFHKANVLSLLWVFASDARHNLNILYPPFNFILDPFVLFLGSPHISPKVLSTSGLFDLEPNAIEFHLSAFFILGFANVYTWPACMARGLADT